MEILLHKRLKIVLSVKERTSIWLSEQMGYNINTVSLLMTKCPPLWDVCQSKKTQPSMEPLDFAACQSKNYTRLHSTSL